MMIEKWVEYTRTGARLLLFGAGMLLLYWLLEAYIDHLIGLGTFVNRLLPLTDFDDLWMRGVIMVHVVGFIAYAHSSVTKYRQTAEALRASEERLQATVAREQEARQRTVEAYRLAEVAVRVRDDFLTAASHDLRTPLACIVSRVDMLQRRLERRQALPEAWLGEKVGALREAAGSMLSIVEGIVDAAHMESASPMTPEDKAFLFRTLRDPVIRGALERLAPINPDAQTALRVARALDRVIERRRAEERVRALREALSQPGVLDDLRASRDEPLARDLLRVAQQLGIEDGTGPEARSP